MTKSAKIFDLWDEQMKEFVSVAREVSRKRSEKFIPIKVNSFHSTIQERIQYIHQFRMQHQQLVTTIQKVVSADAVKSDEAGNSDDLGLSSIGALIEVNAAMNAIKSVDVMGVSAEGTLAWNVAEESYNEKISHIEHQIIARLCERLGASENAAEMFRIFSKFNALFIRPKIRGAIHEYQSQLLERVKDDIKKLHQKFVAKEANKEAMFLTNSRDVPSLSGSIIWAKGIERQLGEYMKKVEHVLGKGWEKYAQGEQLQKEEMSFTRQLDTKPIFAQWITEETGRKPVGGKIFTISRNKLRGNKLEMEINFDPKSISVFKDVRNLVWLGFAVPIHIQNAAKDSKRVYPFAVSLDETLRVYRKTLAKLERRSDICSLVATYQSSIQALYAKGVQLRWDYFIFEARGISSADNRQVAYVRELASAVTVFHEKTTIASQYCLEVERLISEMGTVPYEHQHFLKCLKEVQKCVDLLNYEFLSNMEEWAKNLEINIEAVLLKRLCTALKVC